MDAVLNMSKWSKLKLFFKNFFSDYQRDTGFLSPKIRLLYVLKIEVSIKQNITNIQVHISAYETEKLSSVTQLFPTLCDPMGCSNASPSCPSATPGAWSD